MFVVTRVGGNGASGQLPRGTEAHLGDLAEPTSSPMSAPLVGPHLWYGMGRFYGTLTPILAVASTQGNSTTNASFGMLNQFTLEYYFKVPIKLGLQVAPMGFVVGNQPGVATEMQGQFAFSSSYFELGLSAGAELHLVAAQRPLVGWLMRLGSLDGLNLIFRNSYAVQTGSYTGNALQFGSINAEINIPLAQRFTLYMAGGGAESYAYGTIGLKHYLRGGGGPGSLILHAGAGGAYVSDRCIANVDSTNYAQCQAQSSQGFGPALSLGLDARF
jgi:hypothetical protein